MTLDQIAEVVATSIWGDCDANLPVADALNAQIPSALSMISPATLADVGESADPFEIALVSAICEGFMFRCWLGINSATLESLAAEDAAAPETEIGHPHRAIDMIRAQILFLAAL